LLFFPSELAISSDNPFKDLFTDSYRLWILSRGFLFVNLLTSSIAFTLDTSGTSLSGLINLLSSLLYFFLYPFAAFLVCFYWVYLAAEHRSLALLSVASVGILLQLIAVSCMAAGLLTGACGGVLSTLNLLRLNSWLLLAGAVLCQFILLLSLLYIIKLLKQAISLLFRRETINSSV